MLVCTLVVGLGCRTSPWSTSSVASTPAPAPTPPSGSAAASAREASGTKAGQGTPDPQAIEAVVAEVRRSLPLNAQAEEELKRNLSATSPHLWPLVVEQFRAAIAYRRQAEERERATGRPEVAQRSPLSESRPTEQTVARAAALEPKASETSKKPTPPAAAAPPTAAAPPGESGAPDRVVPAGYQPRMPGDWRQALAETSRLLEARLSASPQSAEEVADHARLRMLYLVGGRRDDAMRPIPSLAPAMQDFWSKELCGLSVLLDTQKVPDPMRRAGEAEQHLAEAAARLAEAAPLVVRNLAFVTDVQSYGSFRPFESYSFKPGQRVLLYAEIDNFKSTETPRGYHTSLQSSYQIFDSQGRRVAEHDFGTNEEYCRNPRRDFFIGYEFVLPKRIYPGKHTLQLTVTDLNADKVGQSSIEFTITGTE